MARTRRKFQPTRPLRGATDLGDGRCRWEIISTHAPLAGRDRRPQIDLWRTSDFNPRAPCGARLWRPLKIVQFWIFQPTRPLRGATDDVGTRG